jgi:hypothetical protein
MSLDLVFNFFQSNESAIIMGLFWLFCAAATAMLASTRGRNSFKWFAWGLLMGPFAFVLAIQPSPAAEGNPDETTKKEK